MNTLQEDESEDEEGLFGLREMGGEESAEEDNAFPASTDQDSEESTDEGEPPPRGVPNLPPRVTPPPPRRGDPAAEGYTTACGNSATKRSNPATGRGPPTPPGGEALRAERVLEEESGDQEGAHRNGRHKT